MSVAVADDDKIMFTVKMCSRDDLEISTSFSSSSSSSFFLFCLASFLIPTRRVLGLSVRDYAGSPDNLAPKCPS